MTSLPPWDNDAERSKTPHASRAAFRAAVCSSTRVPYVILERGAIIFSMYLQRTASSARAPSLANSITVCASVASLDGGVLSLLLLYALGLRKSLTSIFSRTSLARVAIHFVSPRCCTAAWRIFIARVPRAPAHVFSPASRRTHVAWRQNFYANTALCVLSYCNAYFCTPRRTRAGRRYRANNETFAHPSLYGLHQRAAARHCALPLRATILSIDSASRRHASITTWTYLALNVP